jgi:hypothetical protein
MWPRNAVVSDAQRQCVSWGSLMAEASLGAGTVFAVLVLLLNAVVHSSSSPPTEMASGGLQRAS